MSATKRRFSRASVTEYLMEREERLRTRHGFSDRTGWAQVRGKPIEVVVEYGQWTAVRDMLRDMHEGTL